MFSNNNNQHLSPLFISSRATTKHYMTTRNIKQNHVAIMLCCIRNAPAVYHHALLPLANESKLHSVTMIPCGPPLSEGGILYVLQNMMKME